MIKVHDIPYDWKKALWECTDFQTWLVFSDWLEEHNEIDMAIAIRWLATNEKIPHIETKWPPIDLPLKSRNFAYRWYWYETDYNTQALLPKVVYDRLPHRLSSIVSILFSKWTASILKAYFNAAKALIEERDKWRRNPRPSGAVPNWIRELV